MQRQTIKKVEDTILDAYLGNLEPLTVIEIRETCQLSETIIRRAVKESRLVTRTDKEVVIMSRTSPGRVHQMRVIDAFYPTRQWLAELLKQNRKEYDYWRTERKWR